EGYRPSTNQPGHHQTVIQALPLTIGLDQKTMILLDSLRKQRNVSDYSGDPVSPEAVASCIRHAELLLSTVQAWLLAKHPDLG
ncbi:MAG: DNA-binding protein, partial [Burkholderiaceae bacterium]|nr:DNA-binding protein [Burkholderiaceae bacterium]